MGTRNLTCVYLDGKPRIAQYCQWDGYPSGQGVSVYKFLKSLNTPEAVENFKEKVQALREVESDELKAKWVSCGASPTSDLVNMEVADRFKKRFPHLHRDCGAKILSMVAEGLDEIELAWTFAASGLFCEWAYVIDLDTMTLEVYAGFFKEPLNSGGRFDDMERTNEAYTPVQKIKEYPIAELPDDEDEYIKELDSTNNELKGYDEEDE
jgi:hypothetical protein